MASMVMASPSKSLKTQCSSLLPSKPKFPHLPKTLPMTTTLTVSSLPKLQQQPPLNLSSLLKSTTTTLSLSLTAIPFLLPLPSLAEEIEKASLFDFNLTLPIIMAEFLLLMFALDKIYYTPLGDFMDKRDAQIKAMLSDVKDTSSEVKQLEDQANAVMRAARAEISAALNKMKKETQVEVEAKIAEGRKKIEAELQEALASLEKQKEETILALDSQIAAMSEDIVKKVLPVN